MHTRQWTCDYSRTCNCGVVLRDHNDVIEFNCCNEYLYYDNVTPIRVKVRSKKRLAPGISINQTLNGFNSQYRVNYCLFLFTLRPQYLTTRNISHIVNEAEVNTPFSTSSAARQSGNFRQMVNDTLRSCRPKIPNQTFRNFLINGKQPLFMARCRGNCSERPESPQLTSSP